MKLVKIEMKGFSKYIILIFSIFFISLTWGCKKRTQNKLIGNWEMVFFDKYDAPYSPYISEGKIKSINFSFESGDKVLRSFVVTKTDGTSETVIDTGSYSVITKKLQTHVKLSNLKDVAGTGGDDGLWWIDKLNSKTLRIQRVEMPDMSGGPYRRYEFQKK